MLGVELGPWDDTGLEPWADLRREGASLATRSAYHPLPELRNAHHERPRKDSPMSLRFAVRPTRRRTIAVIASLTIALLTIPPSHRGFAIPAAPNQPKPTVVLEHGAWADG